MHRSIKGKLTTEEAAKYIGLHVGTLANWRHQGKGPPYIKFRNSIYYSKKDLNIFMKEEIKGV